MNHHLLPSRSCPSSTLQRLTLFVHAGLVWYFHNPSNSNMDYRIFNVRGGSFCLGIHTGGHRFIVSPIHLLSIIMNILRNIDRKSCVRYVTRTFKLLQPVRYRMLACLISDIVLITVEKLTGFILFKVLFLSMTT